MNRISDKDDAVIRVSFDVRQSGGNLVWHVDNQHHRNLYKHSGPYAGSVHLLPEDNTYIEVWAFGPLDEEFTIDVVEAALITVPHTDTNAFSVPSPFGTGRAVHAVTDWSRPQYWKLPPEKQRRALQTTLKPLLVGPTSGRWDLSLVITVNISRPTINGVVDNFVRVFTFDPESEVGTGADTGSQ